MAPLWPFGKKKPPLMLDEPEPEPIMYRKNAEETEQVLMRTAQDENQKDVI